MLGGELCLDFVNTLDPRLRAPREEFLGNYADLVRWAAFVGAISPNDAAMLARGAGREPRSADAVHARAVALREALYVLLTPRPVDEPSDAALATLHREWLSAMEHARLRRNRDGFVLGWEGVPALDGPLWPVARSAVSLMTSSDLRRVRECRGEGCGWLFVDTSKAQRRRWCSMAICGNREKARRHRERTRGGSLEDTG